MVDDMTLPPSERRNRDGPGAEPPQRLHGIASLPPSEESPRAETCPAGRKASFRPFKSREARNIHAIGKRKVEFIRQFDRLALISQKHTFMI